MNALSQAAVADHLSDAVAAYTRHDMAAAAALLRPHAEAGDADAQAWLGAVHAAGSGGTASLGEAFRWYLKAASRGNVTAQTNVGAMLAMGQGVARNIERGMVWLEKAASAGDPMARYNLATLYAKGDGAPPNLARAAALYRQAAEDRTLPLAGAARPLLRARLGPREEPRLRLRMALACRAARRRHCVERAGNRRLADVGRGEAERSGAGRQPAV